MLIYFFFSSKIASEQIFNRKNLQTLKVHPRRLLDVFCQKKTHTHNVDEKSSLELINDFSVLGKIGGPNQLIAIRVMDKNETYNKLIDSRHGIVQVWQIFFDQIYV